MKRAQKKSFFDQIKSFKLRNVAMTLIGLNVIMFIIQAIVGDSFTQMFMLVAGDIFTRPWILLTSMFLHSGTTHIFFNMYALLIFGPLLEQRIGSKRLLISYLTTGIFAGIIYSLYHAFLLGAPQTAAVGASGAIMGFLGLVIMLLPKMRILFFFIIPMNMRTAGIIFAAIDLIGFITPGDGIAHLAHLAGLAAGLAFGYYFVKQKNSFAKRFTGQQNRGNGMGPGIRIKVHKAQFGQGFPNKKTQSNSTANNSNSNGNYEDTIEMSKNEVDDYFKYGKI